MKKLNKKGFTIVELVIVIAVIAILAAVLIPTFSGVVDKANKSAALQEARNVYTEYTTAQAETGNYTTSMWILTKKGYYVKIENGGAVADSVSKEVSKGNEIFKVKPADAVAAVGVSSTDTTVVSTTTYYTRTDKAANDVAGYLCDGKFNYTKVASPTGDPSNSSYYVLTEEGSDKVVAQYYVDGYHFYAVN